MNGFCPERSEAPSLCEAGFFGNSTLTKMVSAEDCIYCPEGKFCTLGFIAGDCAAGYFCDFGAIKEKDPSKICPAGHYCPAGTTLPVRCPNGYYFPQEGAERRQDCRPCLAGEYCIENDAEPRQCPAGHYCDAISTEPIPCRVGFYNVEKGSTSIRECLACPPGYNCDAVGISDFTKFPCPVGHYCEEEAKRTPPKKCKAGLYQPYEAKTSSDDCIECPSGHYCREGADYPEACDAGYICPVGSKKQYACAPGTYCPAMSEEPIDCPESFYCPGYRTDIYAKCTNGTFCGESTRFPESCPAGYFGSSNTSNVDLNSACFACGEGQYSNSGSNTCEDCYAGFVCEKAARKPNPRDRVTEGGYECPPGFYCPVASTTPIACPLGHYSDTAGNGYANQCKPCPENFFGIEVGATSCQACQGGTISDVGSTSCRC